MTASRGTTNASSDSFCHLGYCSVFLQQLSGSWCEYRESFVCPQRGENYSKNSNSSWKPVQVTACLYRAASIAITVRTWQSTHELGKPWACVITSCGIRLGCGTPVFRHLNWWYWMCWKQVPWLRWIIWIISRRCLGRSRACCSGNTIPSHSSLPFHTVPYPSLLDGFP